VTTATVVTPFAAAAVATVWRSMHACESCQLALAHGVLPAFSICGICNGFPGECLAAEKVAGAPQGHRLLEVAEGLLVVPEVGAFLSRLVETLVYVSVLEFFLTFCA